MRNFALISLFLAACGGGTPPSTPAPAPTPAPVAAPAPAAPAAPAADAAAAPAEGGEATADAAAASGDPLLADGEKVYKQYCIACHQADGKGMNGTLAADYTSGRLNEKTDEELLTSIREGFTGKIGSMPPWKGVLTDDQMKAALHYVKTTYNPKPQ